MTEDDLLWTDEAWGQFQRWKRDDAKVHARITALIRDTLAHPSTGLGKPEPLKYGLRGKWSRRITREHRLVYEVVEGKLIIHQCQFHY